MTHTTKYLAALSVLLPAGFLVTSAFALDGEIQLYSNESKEINANDLILDHDDDGGDITLQFGAALAETLSWDDVNGYFNFSDDVNIEGNISLTGNVDMLVGATVDGVDVSELGASNAAVETQVNQNITNIANNAGDISNNATNIAGNTTDIANNATDISNNATNIAGNTTDIANNATDISNNATNIAGNTTDIANNATDISNNATNIAGNTTDIANNAADISDLQVEQAAQNTAINQNATDISALEAEQIIQNGDIADLEVLTGDGDFTGAIYLTFGGSLTQALTELDTQIANNAANITNIQADQAVQNTAINQNATDIASNDADIAVLQTEQTAQNTAINQNSTDITALEAEQVVQDAAITQNATDIASNDIDIAALQTEQTAQNTAINQNTADITDLDNRVGDTLYTSTNIVNSGDDVTTAISDLDAQLGAPKTMNYHVPLGNVVIREDGTQNKVNVYRDTETGTTDHHFYRVVSNKNVQQDIDLEFKVKLPEDIITLDSISMFEKSDAGAANAKIDIEIRNASGTVIGTLSGLSNTSWTEHSPLTSAYTATAGEFVYITVKGYSKGKESSRFGDIVLNYSANR